MKRVLVNLIGNAIDNIPVEAEIRVSMGQELPPNESHPSGRVVMNVCDTGPGIPSEMLPHLFDRYFTGHKTRKKIGSGLGLYIARMILNLHGGEINVESVMGKGTCFIICLPKAVQ
ncbi:MAG: sensor histidine kinase [Cyanobacteria bacterium]|nr:sensor histidine kinase [Cyanobacteriota bacterium]